MDQHLKGNKNNLGFGMAACSLHTLDGLSPWKILGKSQG